MYELSGGADHGGMDGLVSINLDNEVLSWVMEGKI